MAKEPVTVFDVAAYILRKSGSMSTMKLQKLVYYSQAWSLVWDEKPLYGEKIEAWANGPVVRDLYNKHRGLFQVDDGDIEGDPNKLKKYQKETVDAVLRAYGEYTGQQLSDISHAEPPWVSARGDLPNGAASTNLVDLDEMQSYFSAVQSASL